MRPTRSRSWFTRCAKMTGRCPEGRSPSGSGWARCGETEPDSRPAEASVQRTGKSPAGRACDLFLLDVLLRDDSAESSEDD
jgi:hypothetical protein